MLGRNATHIKYDAKQHGNTKTRLEGGGPSFRQPSNGVGLVRDGNLPATLFRCCSVVTARLRGAASAQGERPAPPAALERMENGAPYDSCGACEDSKIHYLPRYIKYIRYLMYYTRLPAYYITSALVNISIGFAQLTITCNRKRPSFQSDENTQ